MNKNKKRFVEFLEPENIIKDGIYWSFCFFYNYCATQFEGTHILLGGA